jgi:hypothetical protein
MHIGRGELISFKIAVNEAAELYAFPLSTAAFQVTNDIIDYNKRGQLKKELSRLCQQIFVINGVCANQNKALTTLAKLQNHGITEDQMLYLNNFLETNKHKINVKSIS